MPDDLLFALGFSLSYLSTVAVFLTLVLIAEKRRNE